MSDTVLVLGGGLTGLRAAVEIAGAGCRAVVVEQRAFLGGQRAALLFGPDCPDPRLPAVADNPLIECHTLAELVSLSGEPGAFTATVRETPRYVTEDCTRCNHCVPVCPQVVANEYDADLTFRKAIHRPLPRTIPDLYAIDVDSCLNAPPNYLPCQRCAEACDDGAIRFDLPTPEPLALDVAAVVVATGFSNAGAAQRETLAEFGYGTHPDIVSDRELQRLLEDPGPSGGYAVKPSDEGYPDAVLLVLTGIEEGALWVLVNHLRRLAAQDIDAITVLVLAADGVDAALDPLRAAAGECGADLRFGAWLGADTSERGAPEVTFTELPRGGRVTLAADLVALYHTVQPDAGTALLAERLGLARDARGYLEASRPGIYLAGGAQGTVGVARGGDEALAAVQAALQLVTREAADDRSNTAGAAAPPTALRREDVESLLFALLRLGEGAK